MPVAKGTAGNGKYFWISIVDEQTGRGVPLVELTTVNAIRYITDSHGIIAFHEPSLMNQTVFFHIKSHGYRFPKDKHGYMGTGIRVTEGGHIRLKINRINIAERLYGVTGAGIDRDSVLVGHPLRHVWNGTDYVIFPMMTRIQAQVEDYLDLSKYETYTCFIKGCREDSLQLDRGPDGRLRYSWKADTPIGPWVDARKIVTHDKYSFYNPKQHPMFDKQDGRFLFFEGTYTHTFSGNPDRTPRYNYNQIMYKLDLADPRLVLPVPVYKLSRGDVPDRFGTIRQPDRAHPLPPIGFYALDRKKPGVIGVFERQIENGLSVLEVGTSLQSTSDAKLEPLFFALPADTHPPPPNTVPLHEFVHQDEIRRAYSVDLSWNAQEYRRSERPLCLVWRNPRR